MYWPSFWLTGRFSWILRILWMQFNVTLWIPTATLQFSELIKLKYKKYLKKILSYINGTIHSRYLTWHFSCTALLTCCTLYHIHVTIDRKMWQIYTIIWNSIWFPGESASRQNMNEAWQSKEFSTLTLIESDFHSALNASQCTTLKSRRNKWILIEQSKADSKVMSGSVKIPQA